EALVHSLELQANDRATAALLTSDLDQIKSLTADNPGQQAAEEGLAALVDAAPRSRELLGQIRNALLGMRQEEERLERERFERVQSETRTARAALATGYALALAILALTGVSVFRKMVRRLRSEQELSTTQKQFRLLFDSIPIPVWVYDLETLSIVDVNL